MYDFHGKTALVTGASRGIGRAIAVALARGGARVALNYAGNQAAAEEALRLVREAGLARGPPLPVRRGRRRRGRRGPWTRW